MVSLREFVLVASVTLAVTACPARDPNLSKTLDVVGPVPAAGELVWVNRTASTLVALDPTSTAAPLAIDVVERPRAVVAITSGVLITGGRGDAPEVDLVSLPGGERQVLHVPGAYDHASISPDGRFAVLFYDPSAVPAPGGPPARNNNEVTIIDLTNKVVSTLSLRTESLAPENVLFSRVGNIAAIVLDSAVAFIDLTSTAAHVQVPLKLPDGTVLRPRKALFAPDGAYLYVRTTNSDDVLALEIRRADTQLNSAVTFLFYPGASGLQDILVPDAPGFDRYVAAVYSAGTTTSAVLLDATGDTSRTHQIQLSHPATTLADLGSGLLLAYNGVATNQANTKYIAGWEPLTERFEEDQLPGPVQGAPSFGSGVAFFTHGSIQTSTSSSAALTGVTLAVEDSRVRVHLNPIVLGGTASGTALDAPTGTLFLGVTIARQDSGAAPVLKDSSDFSGQTGSLVAVKADSLAIGGVVLDDEIVSVGIVGKSVYAVHPSALGDVTLVPLASLDRASAHRVFGFLTSRLLDRGE